MPFSVVLATPRPPWKPGPPWIITKPHAPEMHQISDLFWAILILSAIIFAIVCAILIASIVRFSGRDGDPEPRQVYGNRKVEMLWTGIPAIILVVAFIFTAKGVHDINQPVKGATIFDVVARGHQWWWEFYYPSLGIITANEVHLPVNTSIHFHVESADVIHSFWAPELARQIDANPGQDNAVYTELTETGVYAGACYEYCGTAHAWMKFQVVVQSKSQFDAWASHEKSNAVTPTTTLAAQGYKVFITNTCVDCHTINGTRAGGTNAPNLTHVASRWTIGAGAAPMSLANLEKWVRDPTSFKPGALMPPYPLLSKQELNALATYLYSLK